jgi:hypothetical protein
VQFIAKNNSMEGGKPQDFAQPQSYDDSGFASGLLIG